MQKLHYISGKRCFCPKSLCGGDKIRGMARKRNNNSKQVVKAQTEPSETLPQPTTDFTPNLSPIMGCPEGVLERSRIEFYAALIIGIIAAVVPMSGITRSLFLLLVLAPLVDVVWRSTWTHYRKRISKVAAALPINSLNKPIL